MEVLRFFNIILIFGTVSSLRAGHIRNARGVQEELKRLGSMVDKMKKNIDALLASCPTIPRGTCGPCLCKDDNRLLVKHYCDCTNLSPRRDCLDFYRQGAKINGIYEVHLNTGKKIHVYCDMSNQVGGGWTVLQRRADSSLNFYRDWENYRVGFGDLQHNFWLGNDNLFAMSSNGMLEDGNELRVEMEDWEGGNRYAKYSKFQVGNNTTSYRLILRGYSGDAGDGGHGLLYQDGMMFSTFDRDNDVSGRNCAVTYHAGWWYKDCYGYNLNGRYYDYGETYPPGTGIQCDPWRGDSYSLKHVEMKMRRKSTRT